MTKREKVVDDLEEQIAWIRDNDFHKFPGWGHAVLAMRDAIALLKAQEPKLVYVTANINRRKIGVCPNCGVMLNSGDYPNYCGKCGKAVKWE